MLDYTHEKLLSSVIQTSANVDRKRCYLCILSDHYKTILDCTSWQYVILCNVYLLSAICDWHQSVAAPFSYSIYMVKQMLVWTQQARVHPPPGIFNAHSTSCVRVDGKKMTHGAPAQSRSAYTAAVACQNITIARRRPSKSQVR